MATETKRVTCNAGVYTLLCENKTKFACKMFNVGSGRLVVAASLPAPTYADYITIVSSRPAPSLSELDVADKIYFMPTGPAAMIVEVLRG